MVDRLTDKECNEAKAGAFKWNRTSGSLNKFPIYAKIGVPEIWRYNGQELEILSGPDYVKSELSLAFPSATSRMITDLIERTKNLDGLELVRSIRGLIRENLKHKNGL